MSINVTFLGAAKLTRELEELDEKQSEAKIQLPDGVFKNIKQQLGKELLSKKLPVIFEENVENGCQKILENEEGKPLGKVLDELVAAHITIYKKAGVDPKELESHGDDYRQVMVEKAKAIWSNWINELGSLSYLGADENLLEFNLSRSFSTKEFNEMQRTWEKLEAIDQSVNEILLKDLFIQEDVDQLRKFKRDISDLFTFVTPVISAKSIEITKKYERLLSLVNKYERIKRSVGNIPLEIEVSGENRTLKLRLDPVVRFKYEFQKFINTKIQDANKTIESGNLRGCDNLQDFIDKYKASYRKLFDFLMRDILMKEGCQALGPYVKANKERLINELCESFEEELKDIRASILAVDYSWVDSIKNKLDRVRGDWAWSEYIEIEDRILEKSSFISVSKLMTSFEKRWTGGETSKFTPILQEAVKKVVKEIPLPKLKGLKKNKQEAIRVPCREKRLKKLSSAMRPFLEETLGLDFVPNWVESEYLENLNYYTKYKTFK